MLIVGVTGSLGMGKSTAAAYLASRGIPVLDADQEVHRLYEGAAVAPIEAAFPGTAVEGRIDRQKLSAALVAAPQRFAELEAIVHPLVRAVEHSFLKAEAERGTPIVAMEIPLLFETGGDALVDVTIVVSATPELQHARLVKRGVSPEKLARLLERQMPDAEKRRRADFVVDTSGPVEASRAQLDVILTQLDGWRRTAYAQHWT
jgi:dephospho-CoA kinase